MSWAAAFAEGLHWGTPLSFCWGAAPLRPLPAMGEWCQLISVLSSAESFTLSWVVLCFFLCLCCIWRCYKKNPQLMKKNQTSWSHPALLRVDLAWAWGSQAFHLESWARMFPLQTQGCPLANLTSHTRLDRTDEPELKLFVSQIHISHPTGESPKATDDSEQQTFTRLACWNCARLNQWDPKHLNRNYSCSTS